MINTLFISKRTFNILTNHLIEFIKTLTCLGLDWINIINTFACQLGGASMSNRLWAHNLWAILYLGIFYQVSFSNQIYELKRQGWSTSHWYSYAHSLSARAGFRQT